MNCPRCKDTALSIAMLEDKLPYHTCGHCEGGLLSLTIYREWIERYPSIVSAVSVSQDKVQVQDTKRATLCPRCHRIMLRYKCAADSEHGLNFCAGCDEIWLDGNEWEFLKQKNLHDKVPGIFTEPWQRRLRNESSRKRFEQLYLSKLGAEEYDKVRRVKEWLDQHPKRSAVLAYLNDEYPYRA